MAVAEDLSVYTWGLNDHMQLARGTPGNSLHHEPQKSHMLSSMEPKLIVSGCDHGLMTDSGGNLYAWGSNDNGQLGVGDRNPVKSIVALTSLGGNIRDIACKGSDNYVINSEGTCYKWPNTESNNPEEFYAPRVMRLKDPAVRLVQISCGAKFAIAIGMMGNTYSTGLNNSGQLGLGDLTDRTNFTLMRYFVDHGDKIQSVSSGMAHSICKSTTGKMFSWGLNDDGQLGSGSFSNSK